MITDIIKEAEEYGFTHIAELDCSTIDLKTEVRDMCAQNTCGKYGKNWACPPGCGTLDECRGRVKQYEKGVIVQTVGEIEDSLDFESMMEIEKEHTKKFNEFAKYLQENYNKVLSLGNGCCTICEKCTYPDNPCRFPNRYISSMESYGILVSELCKLNNMKYYYGQNTICYVGCYLISE